MKVKLIARGNSAIFGHGGEAKFPHCSAFLAGGAEDSSVGGGRHRVAAAGGGGRKDYCRKEEEGMTGGPGTARGDARPSQAAAGARPYSDLIGCPKRSESNPKRPKTVLFQSDNLTFNTRPQRPRPLLRPTPAPRLLNAYSWPFTSSATQRSAPSPAHAGSASIGHASSSSPSPLEAPGRDPFVPRDPPRSGVPTAYSIVCHRHISRDERSRELCLATSSIPRIGHFHEPLKCFRWNTRSESSNP